MAIIAPMGVEPVRTANRLRLKNPPIVEAAIGITVPKLPDSLLDRLKELNVSTDGVSYQPPSRASQNSVEFKIVDGQSTAVTRDVHLGWRWESSDKLHAIQFKLDGFAFSRMGRYETWESFTGEAKRLWEVYFSAIGPSAVSEYGVRYINKVFIPVGEELEKYLQVYPKTPDNPAWIINESVMRLRIQIDSPRSGTFVHQHVLVPSERLNFAAVILDNDFRYSAEGLSGEELWASIDAVRDVKDSYFLKLITKELLETFNV
jgi:uncharacterized protein (TIGR04255 family)